MTNGTVNITLNATPELVGVIRMFAEAITGRPVPDAPLIAYAEPVKEIAAPATTVPETVVSVPANPVPVAATPGYTLDMLARAGALLAQAGKMDQALALLAKYNVQTVNQLKPEQYGAFATELRALGAQL